MSRALTSSTASCCSTWLAPPKYFFLVSTALPGYLHHLSGTMPDISNVSGKQLVPFKNYKFELIDSDVTNKGAHKIAVSFISKPLLWHHTVNGMLLLSVPGQVDANDGAMLTEMLTWQPGLSIFSLQNSTAYAASDKG